MSHSSKGDVAVSNVCDGQRPPLQQAADGCTSFEHGLLFGALDTAEHSLDPHDLGRYVAAQASSYETAVSELRAGKKRSHWMWYIFPQVVGLGSSSMAQRYAIHSRAEAEAYLAHPILGQRLIECAEALLGVNGRSAGEIMGYPDDLKLQSSMTLFAIVSGPGSVFGRVLQKYYGGAKDLKTVEQLKSHG